MRKRLSVLAACLAALLLVSACSAPVSTTPELPTGLRLQYRDAALIVSATCKETHTNAGGEPCCDVLVGDVLAGDMQTGALLHCPNTAMTVDNTYLLYLTPGPDTFYAEDVPGYTVSGEPLPVMDSEVLFEGERVSLSALKDDIKVLSSIISAPAPVLYYNTLATLVDASDEIFVGRVSELQDTKNHSFLIRDGGATEKAQYNAQLVTVEAYASMKGSFRYGEKLTFIHCPDRAANMLDAVTLQPMGHGADEAPSLFDRQVYLFFLKRGPDPKQNYYFGVNPIQGYAYVAGDLLESSFLNDALSDYSSLTELALAIQTVMSQHPLVDNPELTVVEE
ncbi:MAG: hypothetical protein PHO41_05960 [Eubacteriales bacterium]|nr:hypothetical protein [Eubacteriales bacterium]